MQMGNLSHPWVGEGASTTAGVGGPHHAFSTVNAPGESQHLVLYGCVEVVSVVNLLRRDGRVVSGTGDRLGEGDAALTTVGKPGVFGSGVGAGLLGDGGGGLKLLVAVTLEAVEGDDDGKAEAAHDVDVMDEVGGAGLHRVQVGLGQVAAERAAVPAQGTD